MTVKPIDLQSNISQVLEIGREEQARSEALVEQQHVLDKNADKKSRLVNTRLDESQKGDNSTIKDEQKKDRSGEEEQESGRNNGKNRNLSGKEKRRSVDDRMGHIIDILK